MLPVYGTGKCNGPYNWFPVNRTYGPSSASYHKFSCVYCTDSKHVMSACVMVLKYCYIQCVPLAAEPGISLLILTPMKILEWNLNRSTFVVWEIKRTVSVVHLIVATQSSSPPASFLPDAPLCWSFCHLAEGAYTIQLLFVSVSVCVSSHGIVGRCIDILWRSGCLLFAHIGKQEWIKSCQQQFLEMFGGRRPRASPAFGPCQRNWKPKGLIWRFRFRCNILISGKIIKEMPGSVASGTHCINRK